MTTHTHPTHGEVEIRGTTGKGKKTKALVNVNGRNVAVDFDSLTPIRRTLASTAPSCHGQSAGWIRKGPARSERSALRLENRDRSRLGCSGSGAARQALDAARNIAPESLQDMEAKPWPVMTARYQSRADGNQVKRDAVALVIKSIQRGELTVEQGRALLLRRGIDC